MLLVRRIGLEAIFLLLYRVSLAGLLVLRQLRTQNEKLAVQMGRITFDKGQQLPCLTVLIPVRNEQTVIAETLQSILSQDYVNLQVVVIDDNSSDNTPHILAHMSQKYPNRLKLIKASQPCDGWLGKNNALWEGYQQVSSDSQWLLFADAIPDLLRVRYEPQVATPKPTSLTCFRLCHVCG